MVTGKKYTKNKVNNKKNQDNKDDTGSLDMDTVKKNNIGGGEDTLNTSVMKKNENDKRKKKGTTEWIKPVRNPTTKEQRKMFGKALEIMLITCMDSHLPHLPV